MDISKYTKNVSKYWVPDRDRRIIEEYLKAWNTQENIAENLNIPQQTISGALNKITENGKIGEIGKSNSSPYLYNIWNTSSGNKTEHFGSFPKVFMDNLLYYHTKPFDTIYDPFCGAGIT